VSPWKGRSLANWKKKNAFVRAAKKFDSPIHAPIIDFIKGSVKRSGKAMLDVQGITIFFKEVEQNLYKVQYRCCLQVQR
jgi:excinuclease ABC subunit A